MKFFITDESNISKDHKFDFFIYGGLVIDEKDVRKLSEKIINIKKSFNLKKERPIKWDNINWKKEGCLDKDIHRKIKELILETISKSDCKIIICLSPQDFYHDLSFVDKIKEVINSQKHKRTQEYAINSSLGRFNSYLDSLDEKGMVLADTFNTSFKEYITSHCFSIFPIEHPNIIYPIIQLDNEYSQLHQINDIVLGSITCSMKEASYNFLPLLRDNFWIINDDITTIFRKGINIYPKNTNNPDMISKIQIVKEKFKRLLNIV